MSDTDKLKSLVTITPNSEKEKETEAPSSGESNRRKEMIFDGEDEYNLDHLDQNYMNFNLKR